MGESYLQIPAHYEACLERHGDSHLGVDWPNLEDTYVRHRVMLEVMRPFPPPEPVRLLDFGCGASHLYEYIQREQLGEIEYAGLDISERFVALSRRKFPGNRYWCADVLELSDAELPSVDYAVVNGVFTEKVSLAHEEMVAFFERAITRVFELAERGIAFNLMSTHIGWERSDLFHVPFDVVADIVTSQLSRNFTIRNDYGLFEYTVYVYR